MAVEARKRRHTRFATEGALVQRHNPDGTIPTPRRFVGFANDADLSAFAGNGPVPVTIKVDDKPAVTKMVTISGAADPARVTVQEAAAALNAAGFDDVDFGADAWTGRLRGTHAAGAATPATLTVELLNEGDDPHAVPAGTYALSFGGLSFEAVLDSPATVVEMGTLSMAFAAVVPGAAATLPAIGAVVDMSTITPHLSADFSGRFATVAQGLDPGLEARVIQIVGPLAAAMDFGQSARHGGNGLEIFSFFDDETISIGLPKDVKDREEIDLEGANGTITRMIIGAMLQGLSPVLTLKQKDLFLLEMIQGGKLNRDTMEYDPPLSRDSDHPTFWGEIFSPLYPSGSSKRSNMAAYERILLRSMIGLEGDVPVEAKAWATYAFNLTATEYAADVDGESVRLPAWREQILTVEQFDALRVKHLKIAA